MHSLWLHSSMLGVALLCFESCKSTGCSVGSRCLSGVEAARIANHQKKVVF